MRSMACRCHWDAESREASGLSTIFPLSFTSSSMVSSEQFCSLSAVTREANGSDWP